MYNRSEMRRNKSHGKGFRGAFVSLMIVIFFIIIAMVVFFGSSGKEDSPIKDPVERSKGVECLAMRKALEMAIQEYYGERGHLPRNLSELGGLEDVSLECPITFDPFEYNPVTGKVTCPEHP